MKLRNKKTGKIVEWFNNTDGVFPNTLAELNEEWEDYEEPKTHWMIDTSVLEPVREIEGNPYEIDKEIGNWFNTREEAERAVEKLKAWKRLKDKGFRFDGWQTWEDVTGYTCSGKTFARSYYAGFTFGNNDRLEKDAQVKADLDLLFGGDE